MEILVLGGTRFIGRHLVSEALARGHRVTVFHRGRTGAALFPEAEHVFGDRDSSLEALGGRSWDATVDVCAYVPTQVRELSAQLAGRGGQYLFVSSSAVYAAPQRYGFTEDDPLKELVGDPDDEITDENYGALKVLCEQAAHESFGDCVVVRPTYVVGPLDYAGRFTYWINRLAEGGEVLAPGPGADYFQWIDVRDLTSWMLTVVEAGRTGTYTVAAPFPPVTFEAAVEEIAAAVGGPDLRLTWVERDFLLARGLDGNVLPMWPGGNPDGVIEAADSSRALDTGLVVRPLRQTAADVLASELANPVPATLIGTEEPADGRLDRARERALLDEWHAAGH